MSYWDGKGEKRIRFAMEVEGIESEVIDRIMSIVDDVVSEVSWEGKEDGRFEESYHHVCNPDW